MWCWRAFQHRWQRVKMCTVTRGFAMFCLRYNLNMWRLVLHICRWISNICLSFVCKNLQKLCKLCQESHFVIQRRFLMDGRFLAHRLTKSHFSWPKKHPQSVQVHVANILEYSEFMSFYVSHDFLFSCFFSLRIYRTGLVNVEIWRSEFGMVLQFVCLLLHLVFDLLVTRVWIIQCYRGMSGTGRVIVDSGFTKICKEYWTTAGTPRYVSNCSAWLVLRERFRHP